MFDHHSAQRAGLSEQTGVRAPRSINVAYGRCDIYKDIFIIVSVSSQSSRRHQIWTFYIQTILMACSDKAMLFGIFKDLY